MEGFDITVILDLLFAGIAGAISGFVEDQVLAGAQLLIDFLLGIVPGLAS